MNRIQFARNLVTGIVALALAACGKGGAPDYVASAKLLVDATGGASMKMLEAEAAMLESLDVQNDTASRVKILRADLAASPVTMKVKATKKSSLLDVEVMGSDPAYVEAYLKALVEVYLEVRSKAGAESETVAKSVRVVKPPSKAVER